MKPANDGLRFLLEVAALASLGYWGFQVTDSALRWVLMLAAPLVVAGVWARWVAARSPSALRDPSRLVLEMMIFGGSAVALASAGRSTLAIAFAVLVVVHLGLTFVLDQREPSAARLKPSVSPSDR